MSAPFIRSKLEWEELMPVDPSYAAPRYLRECVNGVPSTHLPTDHYERYRQRRFEDKEAGRPVLPADRCPHWVIPQGSWLYEDKRAMKEIREALKRLDPEFDLIFDPLTVKLPGQAAYHLYRRVRNAYPGADWLIYEQSCVRDASLDWDKADPIRPTLGWVDKVARSMKSALFGGSAEAVHKKVMQERWHDQLKPLERQAKEGAENANRMYKEVWRPWERNQNATRKKAQASWFRARDSARATKVKAAVKASIPATPAPLIKEV